MQVDPPDTVRNMRGTPQAIPPTHNRLWIPFDDHMQRTHTQQDANGWTTCKEWASFNLTRRTATQYLYYEKGIRSNIEKRVHLIREFEQRFQVPAANRTVYGTWTTQYKNYCYIRPAAFWRRNRLVASIFNTLLRGDAQYTPDVGALAWLEQGNFNNNQDNQHLNHPNVRENLIGMWQARTPYLVPNTNDGNAVYNRYLVDFSQVNGNLAGMLDNIGGIALANIRTPNGTPMKFARQGPNGTIIAGFS